MHFIGLDAGSVTVKAVVLDASGNKLEGHYIRHYGHPLKAALELLVKINSEHPDCALSITGSAGKIIASIFGIKPINEIVSQSFSVKKLYPYINTIIELGGEDSKLILLENGRIKGFSLNSVCAAGTGSFLEQQSERLRFSIEEFSEIAARSKRPSKIAGRCSVFAKSDMIHLQQIATPVEDIVAGLCFAVARNFKGSIAQGIDIKPPVSFQGGVAANKGMVRAFREIFELDNLVVPPDFALMGAIGAALKDIDDGKLNAFDLRKLEAFLSDSKNSEKGYAPLVNADDDFLARHTKIAGAQHAVPKNGQEAAVTIPAYLGIDIGSISTNLAVIDGSGLLLAKRYLMTAGRPIEAVMHGLSEIFGELGCTVDIKGVGTTGSGRYMIADYVGADIVKNEITAQATAAIFIDPKVDTIFEIGGQDSKYISIKNGIIVDFEMNKACAAGTGSFLEEQADKLDISVKGEFADAALRSGNPCRLGERCTVFMENSLMANLQRGHKKDDLLAGLAYSIVQNYINRVVAGKPVGKNIFFQGGVAFNKAVVAAFEKYVGVRVTVPANHDVTGAIGMALLAMKHMKSAGADAKTVFKGFELSQRKYEIDSFECKGCPNVCEINRVKVQGDSGNLFYGGRCEKYDVRRSRKSDIADPFSFREEMLWKEQKTREEHRTGKERARLGLPYIFFLHDQLPFWSTLLRELGFEVVVSPKTNKHIVNLGVENVLSEACFPVKVSHGHVKYLKDLGVDALFVPSFISLNNESNEYNRGLSCPHTQTIPYITKAAIGGLKMLTPIIDFERGSRHIKKEIRISLSEYGISVSDVNRAYAHALAAQDDFRRSIKKNGSEIIRSATPDRPVIVIIGRAYNAYDPGVNLEIPKKLSQIGVLSMPMDFLPLEEESVMNSWPNMYWRSGQRILKAARMIRNNPSLFAIYIGNFSCGPDSFILKYFKEEMGNKPFLHVEIDEHSADAGAITRCEAFLDSIEQQRRANGKTEYRAEAGRAFQGFRSSELKNRTVYIPHMAAHAVAIRGAFEACGIKAEMLPESDRESVDIGRRYVSGKECYPYLITAGDMLKKVLASDFRPDHSAFFMPSGSGPCRFGQYNVSHKLILEKLGLRDIPIFSPNQDVEFYRELGMVGRDFTMTAWKGIVAFELLIKCLHETRPYERSSGETESLYDLYYKEIDRTVAGSNGNMENLLSDMKRAFAAVPRTDEKKPLIGVVGEIFVRSHRFSNEDLIKKIEALGGEVCLASMEEWIYYVNAMSLRKALIKKDKSDIMNIFAKRFFQKRIEHKYARPFKGLLKSLSEPDTRLLLEKAAPYVHDSFEGETVLSIGKAIDLVEKGAAGIINAMPFGCMPGTIVTALLKKLSKDFGVPCISVPYDGSESPTTGLQIEAFMEAVKTEKS
ncbi:MAG TPA: acyl-CoA dehydratase activase [Dissulfurispiraceae bacterium]|nr:acyl-CoA dehydratase activase [Dissulfurispiraceae bacterium]